MLNKIINNKFDEKSFKEYIFSLGLNLSDDSLFTQIDENLEYKKIVFDEVLSDEVTEIEVIILKSSLPIDKAKVKFNKILEKITKDNSIDLALMATYYEKDPSVWKFSLVAIDNDNILTNSKRYTFELGENIPTKTAFSQLSKLNENSTLEDYLESFSVEKVVPEFYKQLFEIFEKMLNNITYPVNNFKQKQDFLVRLIGRLLFLKFLEKKGIIPKEKFQISKDYYHFTLEPLFFEILNTPIDKRKKEFQTDEYNKIPYLNGGLFEAHSDDFYAPAYLSTLKIEDNLLEELLNLLNSYNFTIDENTQNDVEVSLDPEFLGNVFENFIGFINPETKESARKETGSYYTPKEVVEYMVNESIFEYLKQTNISQTKLKKLIFEKIDKLEFEEKLEILKALHKLKIIDPAVGSGAFPMGILNKIVEILHIVDFNAFDWLNLQTKEFQNKNKSKDPNYIRKLSIIQNSIFGVDIQPIAIEIAKLRFFLSLLVDEDSQNIEPLPNLEFNFVCANSLIPLGNSSLASDKYYKLEKELRKLKKNYFYAHSDKKQQIKDKFLKIQKEMINELEVSDVVQNKLINYNPFDNLSVAEFFDMEYMFNIKDGFDIVIGNPPYIRQEKIKALKKIIETLNKEKQNNKVYQTYNGTADIYVYFYERGFNLLKDNGILTFITSNKWTRAKYGINLRKFLLEKTNILNYIDFNGVRVFSNVTVDTSILTFKKSSTNNSKLLYCQVDETYKENLYKFIQKHSFYIKQKDLSVDSFTFLSPQELKIKKQVEKIGSPLKDWDVNINYGIKTGFNKAFIIDENTKEKLIQEDPKSAEIIKPLLRGRDIKKYSYEFANLYIIIAKYKSNEFLEIDYPAIYNYLLKYKDKLSKRGQCTNRGGKGQHHWLELDNNPTDDYLNQFEKEKIIYSEIVQKPQFHLDNENFYIEATAFIMSGKNLKYIIALLNSKPVTYFFRNFYMGTELGNKGFRYKKAFLQKLPIPKISEEEQKPFIQKVDKIIKLKKENKSTEELEKQIDELVYKLYKLTPEDIEIIENKL